MTVYQAATATKPEIVCPSWCTVPKSEHLAELHDWDGRCVHMSAEISTPNRGAAAWLGGATLTDGTPDHGEVTLVSIGANAERPLEDAAQFARELLALVESAGHGTSLTARLTRR